MILCDFVPSDTDALCASQANTPNGSNLSEVPDGQTRLDLSGAVDFRPIRFVCHAGAISICRLGER